MKVLQVASSLRDWGGIERYIVYLGRGLAERGHEVTAAISPETPLEGHFNGDKVAILSRGKFDWSAFRRYLDYCRANRFDIVHLHFGPDIIVAALAAKLARAGKVVCTRHVVEPWGRPKARLYLRWIDHLIPASAAVEAMLLRDGVPAHRMTLARAGCPPLSPTVPIVDCRRQFGFEGFTVGVFGRLVKQKGVDVAIDAAALTQVGLEVFGDGPIRSELEARATGLSVRVRFWGYHQEIANAMAAVDAVAIPSRSAEALPFSALEAMSIGRPIVATGTGGIPELLEDGGTGLLVRPQDPRDLARKIELLKESPHLGIELGQAAKALHRELYTVERMAERFERVYQEIV